MGDGEAETGPLATSWHSNKFLNAAVDGAVLPVLHLNGYKIANPTVLARIPERELVSLFEGYGWRPILVTSELDEPPADAHRRFAAALDSALDEIEAIQEAARSGGDAGERPRWPMIVLRSPKGWTGPREVDGLQVEGTWRSHQVPVLGARQNAAHRKILEQWMRSYRPDELFDDEGRIAESLRALPPRGERRMSANPHTNGGVLLGELDMPDFRDFAVGVDTPGTSSSEATRVLGTFLREVIARNPRTFRLFGPDETASNRLDDVFSVTARTWVAETLPTDEDLAPDGRVMEVLSEHQCQGWLEGYLLTGRHGLFNCYEAFIHIVDSMFNQHAKWLKVTRDIPWRRPIASLNYLLSSHVWRQDHNGFSHQDPGFIDHVVNKKAEVIRVYLPPDANTLLSVGDHCLRSRNYVNVIVAGKQPALNYLSIEDAVIHCTRGASIWEWASNDEGIEPDVVLACCGDIPTLETLAAAAILREQLPDLKVRVVNVVDLMRLQPDTEHPHGLSDAEFDALFTGSRAGHLRLPRLPLAHPPPRLPPREPRQLPRARLQGRGDDDDAVRHGHAERPRPVPPRDRRHRPRAGARRAGIPPATADAGAPARGARIHAGAGGGRSGDPRLDVALLTGEVLAVNAGSTSLKLSVVAEDETSRTVGDLASARDVVAVGHRIVHGGERFGAPVRIDDDVLAELASLVDLAPLHNTPALEAIRDRARGAARRPARRGVRHGLPPHDPRRRGDVRTAGALPRARHPPLRVSRALGRLVGRAGRRAAGSSSATSEAARR